MGDGEGTGGGERLRALFYGDEGHDFIVNYGRDKRGARFLAAPSKKGEIFKGAHIR